MHGNEVLWALHDAQMSMFVHTWVLEAACEVGFAVVRSQCFVYDKVASRRPGPSCTDGNEVLRAMRKTHILIYMAWCLKLCMKVCEQSP